MRVASPPPSSPARGAASAMLAVLALSCGSTGDGGSGDGGGDPASGGGGATSSASTGVALPPCDGYPEGPIGNTVGTHIPPDVVLDGLLEGEDVRTPVRLGDLRDCDGRTGVHALYFIAARTSCSVCNAEAPGLDQDLPDLRARGVRVVILMMDGKVEEWRQAYGLEGAVVLADPDETFFAEDGGLFGDTPNGTPLSVIVDPRTGLIVDRDLGAYDRESLDELADRNRGE